MKTLILVILVNIQALLIHSFLMQSIVSKLCTHTRGLRKNCLCMTTAAMVEEKPLFSVAPMMQYTDRHQRAFQRIMSKKTILYTEMVTTSALIHSDKTDRFLRADLPVEEPVVLQLGGSNPEHMKEASKLAHKYGYNEINLNIGCPSEKVSGAGCFGAVLFLNPPLVSELALAVGEATGKPATVKCRIGVDGHETYEELHSFIRTVSEVGKVTHFIIHARIAVLGKRFSPKDNRTIPPLKYDVVYQLIRDFPHLCFSLNGGVDNMELVSELLQREGGGLHGVMVGRAVVNNPYAWSTVDSTLYGIKDPGKNYIKCICIYMTFSFLFCIDSAFIILSMLIIT